jgi:hypothetical protein
LRSASKASKLNLSPRLTRQYSNRDPRDMLPVHVAASQAVRIAGNVGTQRDAGI